MTLPCAGSNPVIHPKFNRNKDEIFEKDGRYNFVDDNNVFVGYDSCGNCCEDFGFFYSSDEANKKDENKIEPTEEFLKDYNFTTYYFKKVEGGNEFDCGGMVSFQLMNDNKKYNENGYYIYLNLYNCQNGYYSHGFDFKKGDIQMREGSI